MLCIARTWCAHAVHTLCRVCLQPVHSICTRWRVQHCYSFSEFLEAAKLLGPFPVVHHKDGSIEVTIHDPKAKVKKEKKRTVPPKATCPPAKRWKPAVRVRKEDEELAITDTFCDHELWKGKIKAPAQLPSKLNVLETFAGAGGLHMEGKGTFGKIAVSLMHSHLCCTVLAQASIWLVLSLEVMQKDKACGPQP